MIKMKKFFIVMMIMALAVSLGIGATAYSAVNRHSQFKTPPGKNHLRRYVEGEVLVKFKNRTTYGARLNTVSRRGGARLQELAGTSVMRIGVKEGQSVAAAVSNYKADANVEYAQPNYIYHAQAAPNDTRYGNLWGLHNTGQTVTDPSYLDDNGDPISNPGTSGMDMNLENAWDVVTDCSSVIVAVVDSGVNYNQEDLAANMWDGTSAGYPNHGYDFVDTDNDPMDHNGHGTHVAGTVGAVGNNATGTTGVCWGVKIMAVRVLDTTGSGTTADIVSGLNFAVQRGAKVVNMSLGNYESDTAFSNAITAARTAGVLLVVAAGNDAVNVDSGVQYEATYPCNYTQDNVVCVAALDQSYNLANFSNYGSTSVDVGAPGTNIWSTWPGTTTEYEDDFNTGGVLDWDMWMDELWGYQNIMDLDLLTNPANWNGSSAKYAASKDSYVYKEFGAIAQNADVVTLDFFVNFDLYQFDYLYLWHYSSGGFKIIDNITNETSYGYFVPASFDLTTFAKGQSTCEIDYELKTNDTTHGYGVAIGGFMLTTLVRNTTSYNIIDGTSMASPHVAGLAAMLFAFNPDFTYQDVAKAIRENGDTIAALAGKTTTGKAADAFKSLCRIEAPTGVSVAVQ